MMPATLARGTAIVVAAAFVQVVIVSSLLVQGGAPDLLLVTVVTLGLVRGSVAGAVLGFVGGLVLDVVTLDTLGLGALVLTLAGFWAGRYAETTGRDRRVAPLLAVGALTVLTLAFGLVVRYLLGEDVVVSRALVDVLAPAFVLNLLLALPVHRLVRALLGESGRVERAVEMEVAL